MQSQGLPGFRDFFPDETAFRNHMFAVWRSVAARYGFEEYDGPPLEPLELYTQKSGDEIVGQLYTFADKGGRAVSLRPEMTPTLARMVALRARALKKPIRWFSIPQLFRYERQQRGRLREHFQLNMDIVGEPGPLADAELIAAAVDAVRAFGLTDQNFRARISDRRVAHALLAAQGLTDSQIAIAYLHIDKLDREERQALVESLGRQANLSAAAAEQVLDIGTVKDLEALRAALAGASLDDEVGAELAECVDALAAMGLADFVDVDLSVVRGLAYYTGIVFELFDAQRSLRSICGGGRYDGLLKVLGGVDLPATGFGMGDVVLGEVIKQHCPSTQPGPQLDAFLVAVTAEDLPHVLRLAHDLRERGRAVEFALKQQSVTKQFKLAAARSARRAVLIGPDERVAGVVVVRDLETGEEERVEVSRLMEDYGW
ncbi:MAG: histidine--tRNA ligase [Gemmatimonadales bacterium]|nr:histidine--tRNA ligase [Gemmatimonadales bacterium]NIN11664.1 histidine--tRNA ligase [Gemmatimonadales bacterium]NIN50270.1 histidine--tRNA ligase [Gemmatimonadales bacterium]NIP07734.1 histidine--tRNA ligase [Gemmatimonadales bacterium]NIQ99137.1 histidine--tRNA ligase [Gemmatimonadales bacterium]